jgi:hypothetical protein
MRASESGTGSVAWSKMPWQRREHGERQVQVGCRTGVERVAGAGGVPNAAWTVCGCCRGRLLSWGVGSHATVFDVPLAFSPDCAYSFTPILGLLCSYTGPLSLLY